jgi:O-methyltransferase
LRSGVKNDTKGRRRGDQPFVGLFDRFKKKTPPPISALTERVLADRLTYLSRPKLHNVESCVEQVIAQAVPGDFLECGVALGGSSILLATRALADLSCRRNFGGYDVFGMIPSPTDADDQKSHDRYQAIAGGQSAGIGGEGEYYGYMDDLYTRVVAAFERYDLTVDGDRISLTQGLFQDTLSLAPNVRVALVHIDCDWHDPVKLCLETIYPHLSRNGFIIIDDYNDYGGCRRAVDDFIERNADLSLLTTDSNALIRRGGEA